MKEKKPVYSHEFLIVRWAGQIQGPYRDKESAMRDFESLKGATLFRRRVRHWPWKKQKYSSWDKGDPPWWSDSSLLRW